MDDTVKLVLRLRRCAVFRRLYCVGIYFDHAATSYPKPEPVYRAVDHNQRHVGANPGRGAYRRALEAEQIIFETRRYLGDLFNIPDVTRIVFTANVTESLNLALKGLLRPGDHVITSQMEHNACLLYTSRCV